MLAWLASVVVLAFVMAATPGPNNALFAAAGARNGYRRTLPMLGGMLAGFVALIVLGVAGAGALLLVLPGSNVVLPAIASIYMAYLTGRLWRAPAPSGDEGREPLLSWWQMLLFQVANPKTLLAVLAFVTGKLGPNSPGGTLADLVAAGFFLATVWLSASTWTLFGAALRARLGPAHWRGTMRGMAVLSALTIPTFWW